jgi:exodeoxyribonuclease VII large subunit
MKTAAMRGATAPPPLQPARTTERTPLDARAQREAQEMLALPSGTPERPLSVGAVNSLVNQILCGALPPTFYIAGEVSNFRTYDRGHAFFTLKETGAELPCVLWKDSLARLPFRPKDGMAVIARGTVKLYEPQGKLQLYVETLLPQGTGGLELAFRQLCEKLKAEGLFEHARKRPIPRVPQRIAVITSRTGDVLHDVLTTAHRRFPGLHILLFPVRVQGPEAAGEITRALEALNHHNRQYAIQNPEAPNQKSKIKNQKSKILPSPPSIDLILLVRGGGSLEDLWAFNEERLARAIVASTIPIATGIGHEPDTTIADLVGDLRGPTPTGITELTIPDVRTLATEVDARATLLTRDLRRLLTAAENAVERNALALTAAGREIVRQRTTRLDSLRRMVERIEPRHAIAQGWRRVEEGERRLATTIAARVRHGGDALNRLTHRLERTSPAIRIERARERVETLASRLRAAGGLRLKNSLHQLETLAEQLRVVSPQAVLDRGYSITQLKDGTIVRTTSQVKKGDLLRTRLAEGDIESVVGKPKQESLF